MIRFNSQRLTESEDVTPKFKKQVNRASQRCWDALNRYRSHCVDPGNRMQKLFQESVGFLLKMASQAKRLMSEFGFTSHQTLIRFREDLRIILEDTCRNLERENRPPVNRPRMSKPECRKFKNDIEEEMQMMRDRAQEAMRTLAQEVREDAMGEVQPEPQVDTEELAELLKQNLAEILAGTVSASMLANAIDAAAGRTAAQAGARTGLGIVSRVIETLVASPLWLTVHAVLLTEAVQTTASAPQVRRDAVMRDIIEETINELRADNTLAEMESLLRQEIACPDNRRFLNEEAERLSSGKMGCEMAETIKQNLDVARNVGDCDVSGAIEHFESAYANQCEGNPCERAERLAGDVQSAADAVICSQEHEEQADRLLDLLQGPRKWKQRCPQVNQEAEAALDAYRKECGDGST